MEKLLLQILSISRIAKELIYELNLIFKNSEGLLLRYASLGLGNFYRGFRFNSNFFTDIGVITYFITAIIILMRVKSKGILIIINISILIVILFLVNLRGFRGYPSSSSSSSYLGILRGLTDHNFILKREHTIDV